VCEWLRGQPNGSIVDLLPVQELIANLEPPVLKEQFKTLPPIGDNDRRHNRGQSHLDRSRSANHHNCRGNDDRGQPHEPQLQSQPIIKIGDRKVINGTAYIVTYSKSLKPFVHNNGWLEVKKSANQRNLYLVLRWREDTIKRSQYLGKVVRSD